jgi:very-short-patch-repair endonuclease
LWTTGANWSVGAHDARMDWQDLTRRQDGAIAREQLNECGLSHAQLDRLIARRDLVELLPGVYSPRPVPESIGQREWAAVLWSGGVLSHRSAARRWQLPVMSDVRVHVTVGDRAFRWRMPGVRVHRVLLGASQRTTGGGLPISTRARTVIDLMRSERYADARDLRDRGLQQGWIDEPAILRSVLAQPGRTGNAQLRRLHDELERGAQAESERLLHAILRRAGLRGWKPQYRVRLGARMAYVDVAFPQHRLAIEVDGRRYHDGASERFEDDRERQNALVLAGWRVIRVTWRMLTEQPDLVFDQIVQGLAA